MVNQTIIDSFSKKQNTVETSTYGSEFVAARTAVEQIMDLRLSSLGMLYRLYLCPDRWDTYMNPIEGSGSKGT